MKKITILVLLLFTGLLIACKNENKIESQEAKEVKKEKKSTQTTTYNNVQKGSAIRWVGSIFGGMHSHKGSVDIKSANIIVKEGKVVNASVVVNMKSIDVFDYEKGTEDYNDLIGHLSNTDFFDVEKFPTAHFELTGIEAQEEGNYNAKVSGNLKLLDVERNITFDANIKVKDNEVVIESAPFTIDRTQWGIDFHKEGTTGLDPNRIISNNIELKIDLIVSI